MPRPTYTFDTDGHTVVAGDSAKKKSPCDGCSYCEYDEEGNGMCLSCEDKCPRTGELF